MRCGHYLDCSKDLRGKVFLQLRKYRRGPSSWGVESSAHGAGVVVVVGACTLSFQGLPSPVLTR